MVKRREFLKFSLALFSIILSGCLKRDNLEVQEQNITGEGKRIRSKVYVIKTSDRESGIKELLKNFDVSKMAGKKVAIKANYNSADEFPASTHPDTLTAIVDVLKENDADIVLAERSGMGKTRSVLQDMGVYELSERKGFSVIIIDDLESNDFVREDPEGSHWKRGYLFPAVFRDADAVIQTCCLKTHRYGGHFTMSLKNSVGMVAKIDPDNGYNYMQELHSPGPQREMIAEINTSYEPDIVIMDGIKGFSKGGPDKGSVIEPGIILASKDRVALDAAGVAVLRIYGTTREVSSGGIFKQEQIARAVELGLGVSGPGDMEVIPVNPEAKEICSGIEEKLREQF